MLYSNNNLGTFLATMRKTGTEPSHLKRGHNYDTYFQLLNIPMRKSNIEVVHPLKGESDENYF